MIRALMSGWLFVSIAATAIVCALAGVSPLAALAEAIGVGLRIGEAVRGAGI